MLKRRAIVRVSTLALGLVLLAARFAWAPRATMSPSWWA